jgi:hypothetical protein
LPIRHFRGTEPPDAQDLIKSVEPPSIVADKTCAGSESRPRVVDVYWRTGAVSGGWYRVDASVLTHMWVPKPFTHERFSLLGVSPVRQVLIVRGDRCGRMDVEATLGIQGRERLLVSDLHVRTCLRAFESLF